MVLQAKDPKTIEKPLFFLKKPAPGNRATERTTDSGSEFHSLDWRCYEEPIQTSCLGKNAIILDLFWNTVGKRWKMLENIKTYRKI